MLNILLNSYTVMISTLFLLKLLSYELIRKVWYFSTLSSMEGPVAGKHLIGLARKVHKEAELFSALQGSKRYFESLLTLPIALSRDYVLFRSFSIEICQSFSFSSDILV